MLFSVISRLLCRFEAAIVTVLLSNEIHNDNILDANKGLLELIWG
jgi:hypothetical protein